jgi:hypothetical protein
MNPPNISAGTGKPRLTDEAQAIQHRRIVLRLVVSHLQAARDQAGFAQTPRLVLAIRRALKSADGARRHLDGKLSRHRP